MNESMPVSCILGLVLGYPFCICIVFYVLKLDFDIHIICEKNYT